MSKNKCNNNRKRRQSNHIKTNKKSKLNKSNNRTMINKKASNQINKMLKIANNSRNSTHGSQKIHLI